MCTKWKENNEIKNETEELRKKNLELNKQLEGVKISQQTLKSNDIMVKYYNGLDNYFTLLRIFNLAFPNPHDDKASLTSLQQLCAVSMKLRLGLGDP